jgi:hypothetical protein
MRNLLWTILESALAAVGTTKTARLKFEPILDNITYFTNYTGRELARKLANLGSPRLSACN